VTTTRRAAAGVLALGLIVAVVLSFRDEPSAPAPAVSTLEGTYRDDDGDGVLEPGPAEPLADREELAPVSRPVRELARFAQISDAHVRDEESPGRPAVLDRLGSPFTSTFRPHESLTPHVLAAAVEAVNRTDPQAVVVTGDLIDNAQSNELDQALAVLGGGRVAPDSGAPGYEGLQAASNPDPFVYRPDVDAPTHRGLLAAAQRPFTSGGLEAPWYPVTGNHDVLAQGEVAPTAAITQLATGSSILGELDPSLDVPEGEESLSPEVVDRVLAAGLPGRKVEVTPDPDRRLLEAGEILGRLRGASDAPGHGPRLDYAFDVGTRMRGIVLDTVRRDAGSDGRVLAGQLAWLEAQLARAQDREVVIFSHQPLRSFEDGERVLALLDRHPRVLAAVAGHTHNNRIAPRRSPAGGYWLVETASLADHPQQSRAFRLVETASGATALETWMVDHAGAGLAGTARDLAFLDAQGGRPQGSAGRSVDRNARLFR